MLGHMGFGWLWILVVNVVFIMAVALLLRALFPDFERDSRSDSADDAPALVRERFARGDVDESEFEAHRAVLSTTARPRPRD